MKNEAKRRPIGVTVLAIFYMISVPLVLFFGNFFLFFARQVASFQIFFYIFPFPLAFVAEGLWSGRKWARLGTVALSIANLTFGYFVYTLYWLAAKVSSFLGPFGIILLLDTLIQLAIIYYMFTPVAKSYVS